MPEYTGTVDATIPMPLFVGAGLSQPPSFSPLKRRAPIQSVQFRRRGVVQENITPRLGDEHQGERKPSR